MGGGTGACQVAFPSSLEYLKFGDGFDRSLKRLNLGWDVDPVAM